MNRRRFLRCAGATAAAVSASALGLSYLPSRTKASSTPVADFSYKPRYLLPSADQTIQFTNLSQDPDGDPLTYAWTVDGQTVSQEKNYSAKLPAGQHKVQLTASDGTTTASHDASITVEPDQLSDPAYQQKPLNMKYKGVRYCVGPAPGMQDAPTPSNEVMDEQLDTIRNELGCNAITVYGGEPFEDRIVQGALMAIGKGFEKIYLQPSYMNSTVDDTINKIGKFAPKVKNLREKSDAIVYMVGHEFQLETAIVPGATHEDRWKNDSAQAWNLVKQTLPPMFVRIIEVCKDKSGYPITYASTPPESRDNLIPWSNPIFESVCVDAGITDARGWNEGWILNFLNGLKQFQKPLICSDVGMESYEGADKYGGANPLYVGNNPYDEEPQARYLVRELNTLNQARIDGFFWGVRYNDKNAIRGHALYNPQTLQRKKGFYMYKSYQRVA